MDRETWSHHLDYVLTLLGYSIGVGTLWKFPYLCMRNGGGAFLIPFMLFTIIGAIPCVFLEMVIGQFSQSGPVNVWNFAPAFKGIGLGTVLITWYFTTYYPALLGWFLYYLYHSCFAIIPWTTCDNDWNTATCIPHASVSLINTSLVGNVTLTSELDVNNTGGMTAAEEFWRFQVLELTGGLDDIGVIRWPMFGCLAVVYLTVYLCMFSGIKLSGKVVYVTVSVPYILITIFLIRGCLLPGAADGIYYYIYPNFQKLLEPKIWIEACNFALYSMGIAMGIVITMAGHNSHQTNCFRDAILVCLTDSLTTIFVGFAFFAIMGHVAHQRGVTVAAFESSGYNLGFIVYPEAVASLPLPQLWSVLTFIMLLLLGIDSLVPSYEIVVTALADQFPRLARRRWLINTAVLLPSFLISIVYAAQGGIYLLTLMDWYAFFPSMALFAMLECFVVSWVYGTQRMSKDIAIMWGKEVPRAITFCLRFLCPALLTVVFCYALYSYRPPKYGEYVFPGWATGFGWLVSFSSILPIPIIFAWTVWRSPGITLIQKIKKAIEPNKHWGPLQGKESDGDDVVDAML